MRARTIGKGLPAPEDIIFWARPAESRGLRVGFEKGKKYLVYAGKEDKDKMLHVSLCSRTRTEKEAEKKLSKEQKKAYDAKHKDVQKDMEGKVMPVMMKCQKSKAVEKAFTDLAKNLE